MRVHQFLLAICAAARALPLTFSSVFIGDSVVLQSGASGARVWGTAAPGATVALTLDGAAAATAPAADAAGRWEAALPPTPPAWRAAALAATDGAATVLTSVRFGHVVLCSGQSNMFVTREPEHPDRA